MTNSITRIEQELALAATEALEQFSEKLARAKLSVRGPEIQVAISDPPQYSSELRIRFYQDGNLHDVFEFFLFRDGRQVVNREEVRNWVVIELEKLLSH
jgi:hypothetical protein